MYTVLIIDDSISMRNIIKDIVNSLEDFKVVDTAADAFDGREKIKLFEPDLVTIDINMPKMDGVTFLKNLMRLHPMPAVIISGESVRGNDIFEDGAVGFVSKPERGESLSNFSDKIKTTLMSLTFLLKRYTIKKPKVLRSMHENQKAKPVLLDSVEKKIHPDEVYKSRPALLGGDKIIGIGSSTGGVESLLKVFKKLPAGLPPIVITQHIPYGFSSSFAQRLNDYSKVLVEEVKEDVVLEKGHAYLAPGNMHLEILKNGTAYMGRLLDIKKVSRHKPSVDIMFRSLNNAAGPSVMAIIMTGMGDDGTIGISELFKNNAFTVAQNEESCVVFGMPAQAIKSGAIKKVIHLDDIAEAIIDYSKNIRI